MCSITIAVAMHGNAEHWSMMYSRRLRVSTLPFNKCVTKYTQPDRGQVCAQLLCTAGSRSLLTQAALRWSKDLRLQQQNETAVRSCACRIGAGVRKPTPPQRVGRWAGCSMQPKKGGWVASKTAHVVPHWTGPLCGQHIGAWHKSARQASRGRAACYAALLSSARVAP